MQPEASPRWVAESLLLTIRLARRKLAYCIHDRLLRKIAHARKCDPRPTASSTRPVRGNHTVYGSKCRDGAMEVTVLYFQVWY